MVALAHLIHQQRNPPLLPVEPNAAPVIGSPPGGRIMRRLRETRIGRALRLLRNLETRLASLRRGEAQVNRELAACLEPERQMTLRRRLDLVREEIARIGGLLR
jgi:hypothetical protein